MRTPEEIQVDIAAAEKAGDDTTKEQLLQELRDVKKTTRFPLRQYSKE